jgi:hypothetical protein
MPSRVGQPAPEPRRPRGHRGCQGSEPTGQLRGPTRSRRPAPAQGGTFAGRCLASALVWPPGPGYSPGLAPGATSLPRARSQGLAKVGRGRRPDWPGLQPPPRGSADLPVKVAALDQGDCCGLQPPAGRPRPSLADAGPGEPTEKPRSASWALPRSRRGSSSLEEERSAATLLFLNRAGNNHTTVRSMVVPGMALT